MCLERTGLIFQVLTPQAFKALWGIMRGPAEWLHVSHDGHMATFNRGDINVLGRVSATLEDGEAYDLQIMPADDGWTVVHAQSPMAMHATITVQRPLSALSQW